MATNRLKIIAISGSLRDGSTNHAILNFIKTLCPDTIEYVIYNRLRNIPPFDPGLDNDNPPDEVVDLRQLLTMAGAVLICTPEYAFGVPGSLKNALDWLVSSSTLVDKPVALITASSVGHNAHASLLLTLGALSANVVEGAALCIPYIRSKMDNDGNVTDKETEEHITACFNALLTSIS
ncbi:NADPH-dependent FMN reductase [Mucilaginibacter gynuensis]|uniref:NADPH-dependent FMN reductase n=1 Tax=Mucilaginibacter gynuensis TaxID=1302236 RepID=A0ABP8FUK2_9SPHI